MEKIKEIAEKLKDWVEVANDEKRTALTVSIKVDEMQVLIDYIEEKEKVKSIRKPDDDCFTCQYERRTIDEAPCTSCGGHDKYSNWQPKEETNKP